MDIILGSSSPLRAQAMRSIGVPFRVEVSNFNEETTKASTIDDFVVATALGKAGVLSERFPNDIVIAADSNHLFQGKSYGKPKSVAEARRWLQAMRGKSQEIHTALVLTCAARQHQCVDLNISTFTLKNFSDQELEAYLAQVDPCAKASGYTPDGPGLTLLAEFIGEPGANLALPLDTLRRRLQEFGVSL